MSYCYFVVSGKVCSSCVKTVDTIFIQVTSNNYIVSQVLTLDIFVILVSWPAQPAVPLTIRGVFVIGFSVIPLFSVCSLFSICYFFLILLQLPIVSIMGRFGRSGCQNDHIDLPDMIGYLKVAPLPPC